MSRRAREGAAMVNEEDQMQLPFREDKDIASPSKQDVHRGLRLKEVQHRTGLGRSTIYRWMEEGKFPKPVRLGARSVAWIEHEIDQWLMSLVR